MFEKKHLGTKIWIIAVPDRAKPIEVLNIFAKSFQSTLAY